MIKKLILLVLVVLLVGCSGSAPVIHYYVIDPVNSEAIASLDGRSVQILDLKIPQYLERFQIARRQSSNQLTFASDRQWGENLRKNLYRTMTRNLSDLLGTADVGSAISRSLSSPDYLVRVSIEAFEQGADGRVFVAARYQISNARGDVLTTARFEGSSGRDTADSYAEMVAELQQLFGDLCRDIAVAIKQLDEQHAD
ncbi:MAG: PqiC family protein [bacterium]